MDTFKAASAASRLISQLGGQSEVARTAGLSRQAIHKWCMRGIAPERVADLVAAYPDVPASRFMRAAGRGRGYSRR